MGGQRWPTGLERITSRIDASGDCWEWIGSQGGRGYGKLGDKPAHRVVYETLVGPIPDGLELDHLCRNTLCVNPDHLEPVTHAENCRRGFGIVRARNAQLARTVCHRGHAWTVENAKQTPRQRKCRACIRQDSAAARARRADAIEANKGAAGEPLDPPIRLEF